MNRNTITRVRKLPDGRVIHMLPDGAARPYVTRTDWKRLNAMEDAAIEADAAGDADNPPVTDGELQQFRRVPDLKQIRNKLKMTQQQFATNFHVPLGTLRDWEQGIGRPDTAANAYLRVIATIPAAVLEALNGKR